MLTDAASGVLERELTAPQLQREVWPTSAHAHWHYAGFEQDMQYAPRVCTLVLFIICCTFCTLLVLNVVWSLIQGLQICKV